MKKHTYFDHNATTHLSSGVLEAMLPFLSDSFGNPSSQHSPGVQAHLAIAKAREQVAAAVGVQPSQVIFTSGGTEANNGLLRSVSSRWSQQGLAVATANGARAEPPRLIISNIEHSCIWQPAQFLKSRGWQLDVLPVNQQGCVLVEEINQYFERPAALCSVMLANNETGVIQPIAEIANLAKQAKILLHTDATQAFGKTPLSFPGLQVQAMTISAHKIGGPKGIGALIIDKKLDLSPILLGGGQEHNFRSGTENVPGIVGFGVAAEQVVTCLEHSTSHTRGLVRQLEEGLVAMEAVIFGAMVPRLPNTSYFAFPGASGEAVALALDQKGFAVGTGAACSSHQAGVSRVLLSMGIPEELAQSALRVSFRSSNTSSEVAAFLTALHKTLEEMRSLAAMQPHATRHVRI